ncbi:MAG: hypothetical protein DRJ65_17720 [Acidobacteria bacterium]|nr:MAG: hypothetical protein DRJ65_17720 [Acidobacteriota bacterium]
MRALFSIPGLRGRFEDVAESWVTDHPRSIISRRAFVTEIGRGSPLRKMTSAAFGFGRDSVAEVTAECCQARFFLNLDVNREGCRGKIRSKARTV